MTAQDREIRYWAPGVQLDPLARLEVGDRQETVHWWRRQGIAHRLLVVALPYGITSPMKQAGPNTEDTICIEITAPEVITTPFLCKMPDIQSYSKSDPS